MNEIQRLELRIAKFLRIGVIVAGLLMLAGFVLNFQLRGNPFFNFETYDRIPLADLLAHHWAHRRWGQLVSYAGLGALISLPLIRVLLTAVLFLRQRDYLMAILAGLVLAGLAVSFTLGFEL